jgi:hypothetical protein
MWCHDGERNSDGDHQLLANGTVLTGNPTKGKWSVEPDGMIRVDRISEGDRHIFKIID